MLHRTCKWIDIFRCASAVASLPNNFHALSLPHISEIGNYCPISLENYWRKALGTPQTRSLAMSLIWVILFLLLLFLFCTTKKVLLAILEARQSSFTKRTVKLISTRIRASWLHQCKRTCCKKFFCQKRTSADARVYWLPVFVCEKYRSHQSSAAPIGTVYKIVDMNTAVCMHVATGTKRGVHAQTKASS